MAITLKPGARLFSNVCTTEMIVVRAPSVPVELTIGGAEPVAKAGDRTGGSVAAGHDGKTAMGKRYVDESDSIELLCTKAGDGVPAVDGTTLQLKDAKALPASD